MMHKEKIQWVWHEMDETDIKCVLEDQYGGKRILRCLSSAGHQYGHQSILSALGIALAEGYPERHTTTETKDKIFFS